MYRAIALSCLFAFAATGVANDQAESPVYDLSQNGITLTVKPESPKISLAEDFIITVTAEIPPGEDISLPDLRTRFKGFRVAEDFEEEPETLPDGKKRIVSRWRLVPEAGADKYRLAPFAVGDKFWTRNVVFNPPEALPAATGGMEVSPAPVAEPVTWTKLGIILAWAVAALGLAALAAYLAHLVLKAIRIHRMSPIERARYELDELIKSRLAERGLFKNFYIRLTMVVRRYISRKYSISAPHLTTEEFLREATGNAAFDKAAIAKLKSFLEGADMVKFAGRQADMEMASAAIDKAKEYLASSEQNANSNGNIRVQA